MGANLIADGATFRVWAPNAVKVFVLGEFNDRIKHDSSLLTKDANGHWRGFIKGVSDDSQDDINVPPSNLLANGSEVGAI